MLNLFLEILVFIKYFTELLSEFKLKSPFLDISIFLGLTYKILHY